MKTLIFTYSGHVKDLPVALLKNATESLHKQNLLVHKSLKNPIRTIRLLAQASRYHSNDKYARAAMNSLKRWPLI